MGITEKDVLKTVLKVPQLEEQLEDIVTDYTNDSIIVEFPTILDEINNVKKEQTVLKTEISKIEKYPVLSNEVGVVNITYKYGDIRRYGAVIDDVTDCTVAINNAIQYGYVDIPNLGKGVVINGSLLLKANVIINGNGVIIKTTSDIEMIKYTGSTRCDGVAISNLTLYKWCNNSNTATVNLTKVSHSTFNNIYLKKGGTNTVNNVGLLCGGTGVDESYTYYNIFNKLKVDGHHTGINLSSATNANIFNNATIINGNTGLVIDRTNSCVFNSLGCEMLQGTGAIIRNSSKFNSLFGYRFEQCDKSVEIKFGDNNTSAFSNYVICGLDYTTNFMNIETDNVVITEKHKMLTSIEYQKLISLIPKEGGEN